MTGGVIEAGNASPHEILFWERPGRKGNQHWAVRQGKWKLVANGPATKDRHLDLPGAKMFLSNMDADVTETKNIADQHPDVVERLTGLYEAWSAEVGNQ